jgi:hypothetical protein
LYFAPLPQRQGSFRPIFMVTGSLIYPLPRQISTDSRRHQQSAMA